MKITLYPHGGSGNHGCEALVRSTCSILPNHSIRLISKNIEEDFLYGINKICNVVEESSSIDILSIRYLTAYVKYHIFHDHDAFSELEYQNIVSRTSLPDYALSIGGDNYCYSSPEYIYAINRILRKRGVHTILWGCSIEPNLISPKMKIDLLGYNIIIARESITYKALADIGAKNIELIPDPAFILNTSYLPLPSSFIAGNTVGINISPMIISNEKLHGMAVRNYVLLVRYILNNTNMSIAFIPHVVWHDNDDRNSIAEVIQALGHIRDSELSRICVIGDHNSEELKGFIARCRFMIAARTHASIAAYSSMIPTLVVGYSVKASGIAYDIFGSYNDYVLPVQSIKYEEDLTNAFKWIIHNEKQIKQHLNAFMPSYIGKAYTLKDIIR